MAFYTDKRCALLQLLLLLSESVVKKNTTRDAKRRINK